jgi:simple sugar transport system substrate-binding protein
MRTVLAPIAALSLVLAACGGDDSSSDDAAPEADDSADTTADAGDAGDAGDDADEADEAEVTTGSGGDITIHMVTHSDDGPFWSVLKRGAEAAASDLGIELVWLGSNNDPETQVQMIEQAVAEGSSGIAASLPSPDQLVGPLTAAVQGGIPVITLNSGSNDYAAIGALTHLGQDEIIAGNGAGERMNSLGATKILCGMQEQSNVALEERCAGLAETFSGEVITEFVGLDADQTSQQNNIKAAMEADPDIDGFVGTGPVIAMSGFNASEDIGRGALIGGFDLTPELLDAIEAGGIAFTVDQQQYLQGYMPVLLLYMNITNQNTLGGGLPILTGPGFVDADNAGAVKSLSAQGTR